MTQINPYSGFNWPTEFQGCRITGHFVNLNGTPLAGKSIQITPSVGTIIAPLSGMIITGVSLLLTLSSTGQIRGLDGLDTTPLGIVVPATDDPDVTPTAWTYQIAEQWAGGRAYSIVAPQNTTIDISQVAPVPTAGGRPANIYNLVTTNGVNVLILEYGAALPSNIPANTIVYQKTS